MAIKFLNTVQVDTSVLYVDTENDKVGVATTNPSELLNVRARTGSGFDGIFIADSFAGTFPITISKSPMLSLASSTANDATATIFMGASATSTDQDSKIQFNRTGGYLSLIHISEPTRPY